MEEWGIRAEQGGGEKLEDCVPFFKEIVVISEHAGPCLSGGV